MKVHHVTAVVKDARAVAERLHALLGIAPALAVQLPNISVVSFRIGDVELHLTAPLGPGPVADHLERHGAGFHHLALAVEDLDATIMEVQARGFDSLGEPIETAPGLRETFLDPKTTGGIWIQLVEHGASNQAPALDPTRLDALVRRLRTDD